MKSNPDQPLVDRHQREVAPLLKRRWLFAESNNFLLYDFFHAERFGRRKRLLAYSNRNGDERALVVYNNRYGSTRGNSSITLRPMQTRAQANFASSACAMGSASVAVPALCLRFAIRSPGLNTFAALTMCSTRVSPSDLHAYQCHVFS